MSEANPPSGNSPAEPLKEPLVSEQGTDKPQASQVEGAQMGAGSQPTGHQAPGTTGPGASAPARADGAPAQAPAAGYHPGPDVRGEQGEPVQGEPGGPELLYGCPVTAPLGQRTVHSDQARYLALMEALYRDGFEACMSVTGVDYLTHPGRQLPDGITPQRFEVVCELMSYSRKERLRVRCQVAGEDPAVPSLFDLWPGTEAHERETFDMFGIIFSDHPDLTRILMPEDWEGHPLRKDYATGHVPVQFKEAPK